MFFRMFFGKFRTPLLSYFIVTVSRDAVVCKCLERQKVVIDSDVFEQQLSNH
jgi:hypothetical protein